MVSADIEGWLVTVLALILIVNIIVLSFQSKPDWRRALITISGFLTAALMIYIPSIRSMRFLGLEAQFKDRIQTLDATIEQLRSIATFTIKQELGAAFLFPDLDGNSRKAGFLTRDIALKQLKEVGASPMQMKEALSLFNRIVIGNYYYIDISNLIRKNFKNDQAKLILYTNAFNVNFPDNNIRTPSSESWRRFTRDYTILTNEEEDMFDDLQYFQDNSELRRPQVFFIGPDQ